jgi:outer membrane protein assembly factor BamB
MSMQARTNGPTVVVTAFGGHIFGLDPATGGVLWEHDIGGHSPRVIVTDTHVFAHGYKLHCMSYPSGDVVWEKDSFGPTGCTLIFSEGRLFSGSNGEVTCFSAENGELLWQNKFPGKGHAEVALGTPFNVMQVDYSRA